MSSTRLAALLRHRRSAHPELHRGLVLDPPWPSQLSGPGYQRPLDESFEAGAEPPPSQPLLHAVVGLQIRGVKIDGKRTLNQGKARSDWAAVVDR